VLALLELLQSSSRTRTVGELADRLGVDERTVRRYVDHLRDLDVPVRSVRGPHGGVRLEPGYRMPPLMLTGEEALAVLLGLVAGRRAGVVAASAGVVDSAVAKVRRVLPRALLDRLDGLLATADAALPPARGGAAPTGVLLALADAVRERRAVELTHTAADGRRTRRTVHPHGLLARSGHWYLSAGDPAGGEVRTFRVDRVDAAEVLVSRFDLPPGVDAAAEVAAALDQVPWRHAVALRVDCPAERAAALFPAGLVAVEDAPAAPGWARVTFRAERLDWVPALLAGLGVPVLVEAPDALRDLVRELAGRLAAAADPPPDGGTAAPGT